MSKTEVVGTYFIGTGIDAKTGKRVFVGIDSHSGGYPYWSEWVQSAERYDTLEKAERNFSPSGYLERDAASIGIAKLTFNLEIMSDHDVDHYRRQKLLAERKKLEDQIAALDAELNGGK